MTSIQTLEPTAIWRNFANLNAVPRPSKKEERVIAFMEAFGASLGLDTTVDAIGNVIIRKPGTPGKENNATVIMQAHLDMVHQKNADTVFDFATEGIRSLVEADWVHADGTTLGADNGIGVAAIMAVLESKDIAHPPIEALFTIDEETGMTGAKELDPTVLSGKILLNLDSEEDDELTIGCAGGIDTNTRLSYDQEPIPSGTQAVEIKIRGLKGGHSGMDIHKGRGNANKLMTRLLYLMNQNMDVRIASFDGGSLRNAIPREASAVVIFLDEDLASSQVVFSKLKLAIQREFQSVEPDLDISLETTNAPSQMMEKNAQKSVLNALYAVPNGVFRMTPDIPDLVETSSSLARVIIKDGTFTTQSLQRSSIETGKMDVANAVRAAFEAIGATVENGGDYPGWAPNAKSPLLDTMVRLYTERFSETPKVAACHAGLECGIIGKRYPGLDMISFGPTIQHAHSPDERVNISSVRKFWGFLVATLENL